MNVSHTPGAIKKFGRTSWRFQSTFITPSQQLDSFVSAILSVNESLESAAVIIDEIIFDSIHLDGLMDGKEHVQINRDITLTAESREQANELLIAAFLDCTNFLFVPVPKPFVIYADHDEFATFFANTKSNLNSVVQPLLKNGFKGVLNYQRRF
jgi:hypothetical protein